MKKRGLSCAVAKWRGTNVWLSLLKTRTFRKKIPGMTLYPMALEATLVVKVWGGRRLATVLGKHLPTDEPYGESWEVHDSCNVVNGELAGQTVADVIAQYGQDLLGPINDPVEGLPLLAKFIDAEKWLSVQVHPDDALAEILEGQPRGKTEAHYILATEGDAQFVIGLKQGTTPEHIREAIADNAFEPYFIYKSVTPGEVLYMEAGTVHAIGPGVLLYEIQQSSNTTYRFYDWGRVGLDGNPRELHIEKGIKAAKVGELPPMQHTAADRSVQVSLIDQPFFQTTLYQLTADQSSAALNTNGTRFHILSCIDGEVTISAAGHDDVALSKGRSALIPAILGSYALTGLGRLLQSQQPGD